MKNCRQCGAPLPLQSGRGRPRTRCRECAPPQKKPQRIPLSSQVAPGLMVDATRAELEAAGVAGSSGGVAALAIAAAIDSGEETGSALAALVKQHGATMRGLVSDVPAEADPIQVLRDELASRRVRHSN